MFIRWISLGLLVLLSSFAIGCNREDGSGKPASKIESDDFGSEAQPTPSRIFTPTDVAKLKWIEGTWRGMDGDKPFFERYRIENDTTMIVDSFTDETLSKIESTGRFELRNGEFGQGEGDKRSAASRISLDSVQFVPAVPGKGNLFRFELQSDGTWNAILDWPATADKPAKQKIYKMEPWPKK
jgi:hypothetical protein